MKINNVNPSATVLNNDNSVDINDKKKKMFVLPYLNNLHTKIKKFLKNTDYKLITKPSNKLSQLSSWVRKE